MARQGAGCACYDLSMAHVCTAFAVLYCMTLIFGRQTEKGKGESRQDKRVAGQGACVLCAQYGACACCISLYCTLILVFAHVRSNAILSSATECSILCVGALQQSADETICQTMAAPRAARVDDATVETKHSVGVFVPDPWVTLRSQLRGRAIADTTAARP